MNASPDRRFRLGVRLAAVAIAMVCSIACYAKSAGVGEDSALQSGPCYQALVDKNAAQPTTAPNRELGSACETEHGDIEKAWARVLRLWGSDSTTVPDYDSYRPADAPLVASAPKWVAFAGLLLAFVIFGTPLRSAARLMGGGGPALQSGAELVVALVVRGAVGLALMGIFGVPYITGLGGILLIALMLRSLKPGAAAIAAPAPDRGSPPGRLAIFAADAINDIAGAAIGLAAIALFAQRDSVLLAAALALCVIAAAPPLVSARRRLRTHPMARTIAAALLAAAIGVFALSDPPIAAALGGAALAGVLIPLACAAAAVAAAWRIWGASLLRATA